MKILITILFCYSHKKILLLSLLLVWLHLWRICNSKKMLINRFLTVECMNRWYISCICCSFNVSICINFVLLLYFIVFVFNSCMIIHNSSSIQPSIGFKLTNIIIYSNGKYYYYYYFSILSWIQPIIHVDKDNHFCVLMFSTAR